MNHMTFLTFDLLTDKVEMRVAAVPWVTVRVKGEDVPDKERGTKLVLGIRPGFTQFGGISLCPHQSHSEGCSHRSRGPSSARACAQQRALAEPLPLRL